MTANFPTSLPTADELRTLVNNCATALSAGVDAVVTTIPVDDTTLFPSSGDFTIVSAGGSEIVTYTGKTANSFTGCTRGAYGTTAAAHITDDTVNLFYIAYHHNQLRDELIAIAQNIVNRFGLNVNMVIPAGVTLTLNATSQIIWTTPDGAHTYRWFVDNNGIFQQEQLT